MLAPCLLALALIPTADPKPRLDPDGLPLPAEAVRRFGSARFCTDPPRSVAFSPDGKTAYLVPTGSRYEGWKEDRTPVVSAWEMATGRMVWQFASDGLVGQQAAVSEDGKTVWVAARQGRKEHEVTPLVRVKLSAATGKQLERKVLERGLSDAIDLRPDGTLSWDRYEERENDADLSLRILKPDGSDGPTWDPPGEMLIERVRFAPDGKTVFVGGRLYSDKPAAGNGSKLAAVETATGKTLWMNDTRQIDTLAVSPDGKVLATAMTDEPPPKKFDANYKPRQTVVVGWHTDSGTDFGTVRVGRSGRYWTDFYERGPGRPLTFTPDGKTLLAMDDESRTVPIDVKTWEARAAHVDASAKGWFAPDGKAYFAPDEYSLSLRAADTHDLAPPFTPLEKRGPFYGLVFHRSADGSRLAGSNGAFEEVEWDLDTGREVALVPRVKDSARTPRESRKVREVTGRAQLSTRLDLALRSPDGKLLLRGFDRADKRHPSHVEVVDAGTGRSVTELALKDSFVTFEFTPDSKRVVGVGMSRAVMVWDAAKGGDPAVAESPKDHGGKIDRMRLHPTADWMAVVEPFSPRAKDADWSWRMVRYDLNPLKRGKTWTGPGEVRDFHITPDGRIVGCLVFQKQGVYPHQIKSAFVIHPDKDEPFVFPLDTPATTHAFSADGRTAAFGVGSGDIAVYELLSGQRRHTFTGLTRVANSLAFSPDGLFLASSSPDGPVLLWDVRGDLTRPARPDAAGWEQAWTALGGDDAAKAFQAIRLFALHSEEGVPELMKRLAERKAAKACERAVEAMQLANTEAARKAIAEWAKGPADDVLTKAAKGR